MPPWGYFSPDQGPSRDARNQHNKQMLDFPSFGTIIKSVSGITRLKTHEQDIRGWITIP